MNAGVKTKELSPSTSVDDLLGNNGQGTVRIPVDVLAALLVADGPLSAAMSQLRDQITSGLIVRSNWAGLMALSSTVDGAGAEVLITDTGTHNQATATGYDGASVANAGRYSLNLTWNRWVRISDTSMASKADLVEGAVPEAQLPPKADLQDGKLPEAQLPQATADAVAQAVSAHFTNLIAGRHPGFNTLLAEWVERAGDAVTHYGLSNGGLGLGAALIDVLGANSLGADYLIRFASGQTPVYGNDHMARIFDLEIRPLGPNAMGYIAGLFNVGDDKVLAAWDERGAFEALIERHVTYLKDGDVYELRGTEERRLTTSGDCFGLREEGFGYVRFGSTRSGFAQEYRMHLDRPGSEEAMLFLTGRIPVVTTSGQSLEQSGANVAASTTALNSTLLFMLSPRPVASGNEVAGLPVVPLTEVIYESGYNQGFASLFKTIPNYYPPITLTGRATGGQQIEALMPGGSTGDFEELTGQLQTLQDHYPEGVRVLGHIYTQGRADALQGDPNYTADLRGYKDAYDAMYQSVTGDAAWAPRMLITQNCSAAYYLPSNRPGYTGPLAELAADDTYDDFLLCGPDYPFSYRNSGADSHPDTSGQIEMKTMQVAKLDQFLRLGRRGLCIKWTDHALNDNVLTITCQVPEGELVRDTTRVLETTHDGLDLIGSNGTEISSVAIANGNELVVTFNQAPVAGDTLFGGLFKGDAGFSGYAKGARMNIRSSAPLIHCDHTGRDLFDWMCFDKINF
jgi:hypothetical protein